MKRLVLGITDDGGIEIDHDNLSAGEMATLALVVNDLAMKVLKNGSTDHIQDGGTNNSDSLR